MALDIKDPETDRLAHELAELTGEPLAAAAVRTAVRERLERERRARPDKASVEEIMAIADEHARLSVFDQRSPDEIIDYDERGLPS
jgi:antitoxin VapB